ncbi:hypothetical protein ACFVU0_27780 [Streptomyces sp. NPDC058122]|uniref:hypothetical protein n=1 Tax=Streptomyces sp. NPDC058122 TaxID=3346349 RepID=UPI0036EDE393
MRSVTGRRTVVTVGALAITGVLSAPAKSKTDETPPCGVKYLRSSGDGTYRLRATIT